MSCKPEVSYLKKEKNDMHECGDRSGSLEKDTSIAHNIKGSGSHFISTC